MSQCFVCSFSIWPTLLMRLFSFQVAPLLASMYQPSLSPLLFLPKQIHPHHGFWPIGLLNFLGSTNQSASMYISLELSAFVSSTNTSSSPISWDCRSGSCSPIGSYNFNESTIQNARRCLPHQDSVLSLSYYDNDQTESWCGRQCHAFTIINMIFEISNNHQKWHQPSLSPFCRNDKAPSDQGFIVDVFCWNVLTNILILPNNC